MKKLTTKWLIEKNGCVEGVKWFKRNYPDGMTFTKKNINELVGKLLRKKKKWHNYDGNDSWDACNNLSFLLEELGSKVYLLSTCFVDLDWEDATQKQIVEAFWKDYKQLGV